MAERATVNQVVQVGVESTAGTAVAANKLLQSLSIQPGIKTEVSTFRPAGSKFTTVAAQGKEWTTAKISGLPTFTEIIYPLSGVLVATTPSTVDTNAKKWVFSPSQSATDTVKTFSVEQGSSVRAHKFAYGVVTELGLKWSRSGIELDGTMLGQRLTDGATLTAAPTALALVPCLPAKTDIYLADTAAGLAGASALTRPMSAEWRISDRFGPIWALNSANASWAAPVELAPKGSAKLKLAADAEGMGLLTQLRAGSTKFMRVKTIGDVIGATTEPYLLQVDVALKVTDVSEFSDEDGLFAIEWSFEWCYDATWTKATEVTVQNLLATL